MKCLLAGNNVKILARAIHSLAKIGDELHIEPTENGLVLKTVNSSKSAFSSFRFHVPFFLCYSHISENTVQPSTAASLNVNPTVVKCKLPMKSILSVFRSISSIEKTVETCKIDLPLLEALLIIEFKCKHGIIKHFNLRYFECESVDAEFSKEGYCSRFSCTPRFYNEALQNFHNSIPEVTWSLAADQVHLSNYIDDEIDPSKCVRTEVTLAKQEFDDFNVALCTQITFCLKELRAILSFAEPLGVQLDCRMEGAGQPVLFSLEKDNLFSADFLLATLIPASADTANSTSASTAATSAAISTPTRCCPTPSNQQSISVLRNNTETGRNSSANKRDSTQMQAGVSVELERSRMNSLSLLEPYPIAMPMGTDLETEELVQPPPAKRARARYIFQRCLKSTQNPTDLGDYRLGELFAADSDGGE